MLGSIVTSIVGDPNDSGRARLLCPLLLYLGKTFNPFNMVFGTDLKVRSQASPLSHVHTGLPPFLVLYAESEVPGLDEMATDFAAALKKAGNTVTLKEIEDRNHRTILFHANRPKDVAGKMMLDFIARHAGKPLKGAGS